MRRLSHNAHAAGFSLIEALVAMGIAAIVLGIGIPQMTQWLDTNRATGAIEFYNEGFRQARDQAVSHNAVSRLVLIENTTNDHFDWRVDICFPTASVPCDTSHGAWSTSALPATNDPAGATGYRSIMRSASSLPTANKMLVRLHPAEADDVYFTSLGWVNQNITPRLERVTILAAQSGQFSDTALNLSLAGLTSKCLPNLAEDSKDSRKCPPTSTPLP